MWQDNYGWTEAPAHSNDYIIPVIADLLANEPALAILDAGCGNGTLASALAGLGHNVTGVDRDARGIEIARAKWPGVRFEVAGFDDEPLGQYDCVVSTEVIEHLYDPGTLVSYANAALRPGGRFIVSTPYHGYLKNLALSVAGKWDHHHGVSWAGGHIKFFSRETLATLLEAHGFHVFGFRGAGRLPYLWKSMVLIAERHHASPSATRPSGPDSV